MKRFVLLLGLLALLSAGIFEGGGAGYYNNEM